jgi:hypothetical protein
LNLESGILNVFIPGLTCPGGPERLRALGLLDVLGASQAWTHLERGPDGGPGLLLARSGETPRFAPGEQVWKPSNLHSPPSTVFFGWAKDAPPGPEFFARERQISGHSIDLDNRQFWTVPCARYLDGSTALPCLLEQTADGVTVGAVAPHYAAFAERAAWWFAFATERLSQGAELSWDWDELAAFAAEALSLNYRLTLPLALALGLLTDTNVWDVVLATGDWQALKRSIVPSPESPVVEEDCGLRTAD